MTYNIVVTAIHDSIIGKTESYICQLWGDKLVIDDKFDTPRWLLYSGYNVVSVGDVRNLHASCKHSGCVNMNYTLHLI
jgi:hypothetical protein